MADPLFAEWALRTSFALGGGELFKSAGDGGADGKVDFGGNRIGHSFCYGRAFGLHIAVDNFVVFLEG
jgi:hypothetical protein